MHYNLTWPLCLSYDCSPYGSWGTFHLRAASITYLFSLASSTEPTNTPYSEIGGKELSICTYHSFHETLGIAVDFRIRFLRCFPALSQHLTLVITYPSSPWPGLSGEGLMHRSVSIVNMYWEGGRDRYSIIMVLFLFCLRDLLDGLLWTVIC